MTMTMRLKTAAVVEEATMERLVQVYHRQELHNKKWKILLDD